MTLSEHQRFAVKTRSEMIEEIISLTKQLRDKNAEIALLKKKIAIYKSL